MCACTYEKKPESPKVSPRPNDEIFQFAQNRQYYHLLRQPWKEQVSWVLWKLCTGTCISAKQSNKAASVMTGVDMNNRVSDGGTCNT